MLRAVQMMMIASPATTTFSSSSSSFGLLRIKSLHLHHRQFLISSTSTTNSLTPKPKPPSFLSLSTPNNTTHCFKPFIRMSNSTRSESTPSASVSPGNIHKVKFCQWCGGPCKHEIPNGEEKIRAICSLCGKIAYQNPKMVVGCLIEHENKILLCKRNIQPSLGRWTLPAGFMEMGESATEGAIRETQEEAGAEVEVLSPFAQLDIPLIGQTYIIFLAKLKKPHFSPGPESIECRLFPLDEIPFDSLAFSSMVVTLKLYVEDMKAGKPRFHYGTISKRPGTSPSDIHAFSLDYHLQS